MKKQKRKYKKLYGKGNKTALKVVGILLAFFFSLFGLVSLVGVVGTNSNMTMARANEPIENRGLIPEKDELGYWTFTNEDDTDFKILQLTDIHIGAGWLSIRKDNLALNAIRKLVKHTQPDLIIVTGDMVYPVPVQSGSMNNRRATQLFGTFMDNFNIPWAVTYGNHDEEWYSWFDLEQISEVYESYDNCLFQRGPEDITGMSNYFINIKNSSGELNTTLALIDSNSYIGSFYEIFTYDKIHDDQVDWYEQELLRISDYYNYENELVPSLAFFHIPLNEFEDAWLLHKDNSEHEDIEYHYGKAGEPGERIFAPKYRGEMFEKMLELKSTKAVFCGHDHFNDFALSYKGIRLNYGKSIDYLAYPGIIRSTWQRGGTVIEIKNNSDFEVTPVALVDID
ncbi:MAG: metallophosphoesterase [Bacillota bacterium]